MHSGRIIFSQLMSFFPRHEFNKCVRRYQGEYRIRTFSCFDQFLCMAFAQLTYRESLRDIEICLRAMQPKLYHAGIRGKVSRSTLADANEKRDWRIYADFAHVLIGMARELYADEDFGAANHPSGLCSGFHHDRPVSLALSVGLFSATQGRHQTPYPDGSARLYSLRDPHHSWESSRCHLLGSVGPRTRCLLHHGPRIHRFCSSPSLYATHGVLCDPSQKQPRLHPTILSLCRSRNRITKRSDDSAQGSQNLSILSRSLRRISFFDIEKHRRLIFLTNNFVLPALTIALLFKRRWKIELFFKWIKQNLRIKAFYGTSENAVKTQIWIAISVYVLVAIIKKRLRIERTLNEILQVLSITLFENDELLPLLTNFHLQDQKEASYKQLTLFNF